MLPMLGVVGMILTPFIVYLILEGISDKITNNKKNNAVCPKCGHRGASIGKRELERTKKYTGQMNDPIDTGPGRPVGLGSVDTYKVTIKNDEYYICLKCSHKFDHRIRYEINETFDFD